MSWMVVKYSNYFITHVVLFININKIVFTLESLWGMLCTPAGGAITIVWYTFWDEKKLSFPKTPSHANEVLFISCLTSMWKFFFLFVVLHNSSPLGLWTFYPVLSVLVWILCNLGLVTLGNRAIHWILNITLHLFHLPIPLKQWANVDLEK